MVDKRLVGDDKTLAVAKVDKGLNQLKSMDAQQRLAIKAADGVDLDLLKRESQQIKNDKKASIGDPALLGQLKIALDGGKDDKGIDHLGMMGMRVNLRNQLASLYLMQGDQFLVAPTGIAAMLPSEHHTDELFKPQDALKLLADATAANQAINGPSAHNRETEGLFAMGQGLRPEVFKNNADALTKSSASIPIQRHCHGLLGGRQHSDQVWPRCRHRW